MIIEWTKIVFHLILFSENLPNAQCIQVMEPEARDIKIAKLKWEDVIRGAQDPHYWSTTPPQPQQLPDDHIEAIYHHMIFSQDRSYVMNINGEYNKGLIFE